MFSLVPQPETDTEGGLTYAETIFGAKQRYDSQTDARDQRDLIDSATEIMHLTPLSFFHELDKLLLSSYSLDLALKLRFQ